MIFKFSRSLSISLTPSGPFQVSKEEAAKFNAKVARAEALLQPGTLHAKRGLEHDQGLDGSGAGEKGNEELRHKLEQHGQASNEKWSDWSVSKDWRRRRGQDHAAAASSSVLVAAQGAVAKAAGRAPQATSVGPAG